MLFYEVNKHSITLIELIIVIVVLGILISFAMPAFRGAHLRAIDSEAKTNLKILQTALKVFRIDNGGYGGGGPFCVSTGGECNARLGTDIHDRYWKHDVQIHGSLHPVTFSITATRTDSGNDETWHIWENNVTVQDCTRSGGHCTGR